MSYAIVVEELKREHTELTKQCDNLRAAITSIQSVCKHPNKKNTGYDPRGSGTDYYKCPDCLKEWDE